MSDILDNALAVFDQNDASLVRQTKTGFACNVTMKSVKDCTPKRDVETAKQYSARVRLQYNEIRDTLTDSLPGTISSFHRAGLLFTGYTVVKGGVNLRLRAEKTAKSEAQRLRDRARRLEEKAAELEAQNEAINA